MTVRELEECGGASPAAPALAIREQLILDHLPQVKLIARSIRERLPISVNLDDLVSAGTVGLIAAIDRFEPNQHVKLKTYAEYKIRGAILDSLREMDWAPRRQRRRGRMMENAISTLEQRLHCEPTVEQIADELHITVEEYQAWANDNQNARVGSLEALQSEGAPLLHFLQDSTQPSPAQEAEIEELRRKTAEAVEHLPDLERTVLSLYYYEEMTLREIGIILSLHESRISQLKTRAIRSLRSVLGLP